MQITKCDDVESELLADNGLTAMTATFFPKKPFNKMEFEGLKEGTLTSLANSRRHLIRFSWRHSTQGNPGD